MRSTLLQLTLGATLAAALAACSSGAGNEDRDTVTTTAPTVPGALRPDDPGLARHRNGCAAWQHAIRSG